MKIVMKLLLVFVILGILAAGVGYFFVYRPNIRVQDNGIFLIHKGESFDTVTLHLQERGFLQNEYTFRKVAGLKKYPELVKSGRYKLTDRMSNNELINLLRSGRQEPVHFTFNNIRTLEQFAGIVSKQLAVDSSALSALLTDEQYVASLGFTQENLIGMFIPNTYQIYWDISPLNFMARMQEEYRKFWNDERKHKAERASLSPMDVMILASIIEEETTRPKEYPIIAGVYINRLKRNIPLAACPTLKFALGDFTLKRVLKIHTEVESPYNTYKYKGLPPGPVRMPSVQVIDAVLNYRKHDYFYFCAKSDFSGEHHFSRTLRQHNDYARQYHQALNKRKIY